MSGRLNPARTPGLVWTVDDSLALMSPSVSVVTSLLAF